MSPLGVLRKWGTTHRRVHLHSRSELCSLGERRDSKEHQRERQLLCDLEDGQLEGTRLTHNRTFRRPSKRRNPGSVQLCNEQRPKHQTQLSLRGPYTEEAPSQPLQDELYTVDPSLVIIKVHIDAYLDRHNRHGMIYEGLFTPQLVDSYLFFFTTRTFYSPVIHRGLSGGELILKELSRSVIGFRKTRLPVVRFAAPWLLRR